MNLLKKIERWESKGWEYKTNYNTGNHILKECLVKSEEIKEISNGKIIKYR